MSANVMQVQAKRNKYIFKKKIPRRESNPDRQANSTSRRSLGNRLSSYTCLDGFDHAIW